MGYFAAAESEGGGEATHTRSCDSKTSDPFSRSWRFSSELFWSVSWIFWMWPYFSPLFFVYLSRNFLGPALRLKTEVQRIRTDALIAI